MLNRFRQGGLVQFIMGGVVVLIIAAFTLDVRQGTGGLDTECAVRVRGDCVPPRDFNSAFRLWVPADLSNKDMKRLGVRKMILDGLVERQLLLQEAQRLGISIGDDELDRELAYGRFHFSLPVTRGGASPMLRYFPVNDPKTSRFNYKVYERSVRNYARMSTKDFKANQRREMTAARMRQLVQSGVRVAESEVFTDFEHTRSKATVRVAQLSDDWFARYGADLAEGAANDFAEANSADVDQAFANVQQRYVEGCPLVSEIFFAHPIASDASDEAATRQRAEKALARARAGADFAALAREHSSAGSASSGGLRGCLHESEGEEIQELIRATEELRPGELTGLVEMARGFHLLRLERRVAADEVEVEGKRVVALELAAARAGAERAQEFAKALSTLISGDKTMQAAIDELTTLELERAGRSPAIREAAMASRERPRVEVSSSFSRSSVNNPIPNALNEVAARQVAFTLSEIGAVYPEPLATRDGVAVLQLKEREPAQQESFEEEKAGLTREFRDRARLDALIAYVDRLRAESENQIEVNSRYLEAEQSGDS